MASRRVALGVEYDGTDFAGWQRQHGARTVQATLEQAVSRVANAAVRVVAAGRTDAGVHARGQVVHFDTDAFRRSRSWVLGVNSHLPADLALRWAQEVDGRFHARYTARSRCYRYRILCRPVRSPLQRARVWWLHQALDVGAMQAASRCLLGEHDFDAYRAASCQAAHARRRILRLEVTRRGEHVELLVEANAFLHHMVRNIVGVLVMVGRGERSGSWPQEVLDSGDRRQGGITAPPQGLCLEAVHYPSGLGIPPNENSQGAAGVPHRLSFPDDFTEGQA